MRRASRPKTGSQSVLRLTWNVLKIAFPFGYFPSSFFFPSLWKTIVRRSLGSTESETEKTGRTCVGSNIVHKGGFQAFKPAENTHKEITPDRWRRPFWNRLSSPAHLFGCRVQFNYFPLSLSLFRVNNFDEEDVWEVIFVCSLFVRGRSEKMYCWANPDLNCIFFSFSHNSWSGCIVGRRHRDCGRDHVNGNVW